MKSLSTHTPNNVAAVDARDPNAGGASHRYIVATSTPTVIQFQHGARFEAGSKSGVFDDDLLAIIEDRLLCFQAGPFACRENESALAYVEQARLMLAKRVAVRMAKGVLGKNENHGD